MTASWKVTLPCTRAEAEALKEDISPLALLDFPPVIRARVYAECEVMARAE